MNSVILQIKGMHCDGCAATIKAVVERAPGVKAVSVAFETGEARILYDPAATREDRLIAVVERPGFQVIGRGS